MNNPSTVIVTTRNTVSLTLGIIATVLGVLALLVGWIPFLGLLSIPCASIGLLLGLVGFVIALCKKFKGFGLPLVGSIICIVAVIVPIVSSGGTVVAVAKAAQEQATASGSKSDTGGGDDEKAQAAKLAAVLSPTLPGDTPQKSDSEKKADAVEQADYIAHHLTVEVTAKYFNDGEKNVPGVQFKIHNTGTRSLDQVTVTVEFLDTNGTPIHEEDYTPVDAPRSPDDMSFNSTKPLKAGFIFETDEDRFSSVSGLASEWKEGAARAKVTEIKFSPSEEKK